MNSARHSRAGPLKGTSDPHMTRVMNITRGGEKVGIGTKWHGGEYDESTCWIKCDLTDLIEVEP